MRLRKKLEPLSELRGETDDVRELYPPSRRRERFQECQIREHSVHPDGCRSNGYWHVCTPP